MVSWKCPTNPREASGLDPEAVHNFVVMWRTAHDSEAVTDNGGVILFLLFLVFGPAAWYLIQSGINETAAAGP
jgi:hypothetical protein